MADKPLVPWREEGAGDGHTWAATFDSMADYWRASTDAPSVAGESQTLRRSRSSDKKFSGTDSFAEAEQLARFGWADGTASIGKLAARIVEKIGQKTKVERMVRDVAGEFPDVAAYLNGEPESMIKFQDEDKAACGRVVRVSVNMVVHHRVSPEAISRRGAVVVALVDAIEQAGHLAEITLRMDSRHGYGGGYMAIQTTAKRCDEPLNIERLAFALAHTSMFRRMTFAIMESCPGARSMGVYDGGGYGSSRSTPVEHRGDVHFDNLDGDDYSWKTEEGAERYALEELRKLGLLEERDVNNYAKAR